MGGEIIKYKIFESKCCQIRSFNHNNNAYHFILLFYVRPSSHMTHNLFELLSQRNINLSTNILL